MVLVEPANHYKDEVAQYDGCYTKEDERRDVNPKRVPGPMSACHCYSHIHFNPILNQVCDVSAQEISSHDCYYVPSSCGIKMIQKGIKKNKTEMHKISASLFTVFYIHHISSKPLMTHDKILDGESDNAFLVYFLKIEESLTILRDNLRSYIFFFFLFSDI